MQKSDRIPILKLEGLRRSFHQGTRAIDVLRGAGATLYAGEVTALVGPSGSGKSTLLHISGLLETPTEGRVVLLNVLVAVQVREVINKMRSDVGRVNHNAADGTGKHPTNHAIVRREDRRRSRRHNVERAMNAIAATLGREVIVQ